ncbi:MAG TPA: crosslink repair DNA glycosylase YcaQ family protein [Gemmatimonadaceae bacterium]|nr:crosslink repair DNA glycosylase YcaQ family protein [Gemmatimonadaceae bacterium]
MGSRALKLSRLQILKYRRRVGALDERLPVGAKSLHRAAWCGLQDSMPRAALLSMHARVEGVTPRTWEHAGLVQVWGPRFSAYVVAAKDLAVFSLGRLPDDAKGRARAHDTASRLHAFLDGRRMRSNEAGHGMGVHPNRLRYGAATGRILLRWDGAHDAIVWTGPAPTTDPLDARVELARRYLHVFGPTTAASFAGWAGIHPRAARSAFDALGRALMPVCTIVGDAWMLAEDEAMMRLESGPAAPARLLPSGDAYFLLWGSDRALLVPNAKHRAALWTSRVWPGAVLVNGEIVGVWRRAAADVAIVPWRRLSSSEREVVEAEALSLPLPGLNGPLVVRYSNQ